MKNLTVECTDVWTEHCRMNFTVLDRKTCCLHGEAGTTAGQGGLPEWTDSTPGVQTAAASSPAEDDH